MSEITSKIDLPEFCQAGNKVGLVLYQPLASYPIYKIREIKDVKVLKTKIVFTFTDDAKFEASNYYREKEQIFSGKEQIFSGKQSSNSKLFELTEKSGFVTKINLQNTYGKLMMKLKKLNQHEVGLDGYGFKKMNFNDGNQDVKEKCIEILNNISNQVDELAQLLGIE